VRKIFLAIFVLALCGHGFMVHADSFSLVDGSSVAGDIVTFDDFGVKFRTPDGNYTDRVPWAKFSQDSLKQLANNPKIQPLVEPFIEIPLSERPQKPEVKIHDVIRLERPPAQSFFGALLSSSVGLFAVFLIYAANVYSGYEIAVFRARPKALVMGVAAVLPIIGPVIFLSLPTQIVPVSAEELTQAAADPATFAVPGQPVDVSGVQIAGEAAAAGPDKLAVQVFQRGQFTFNRRFFETKFSGYFGVVRHGAEKDQTLLVKTGGGQFVVERITRISANDVHLEVVQGGALSEVMLPFAQIQEIQLQPKTA
jgi:hypothetical protein